MQKQDQNKATLYHGPEENIMVVKRTDFFTDDDAWQGIHDSDLESHLERIKAYHTFLPRSLMELDETYKQIIPYIIFTYQDSYFLMQRQSHSSEQRLKNKFSLGIGGHLRYEDMKESDIVSWAMREFHEEVDYSGTFSTQFLGILNDDSSDVGRVHMGLVLLFKGDSPAIKVKSELKSGQLLSLHKCTEYYDTLESWSQMAVRFLSTL